MAKPAAPGCVTVLCGDPGSNKSFWLLQCLIYWAEHGIRAAMLPLEKNRQYSLSRALAQLSRNADMMSDEWIAGHPAEAREAMLAHSAEIERLGAMISEVNGIVDLEWVAQWIAARAAAGDRIIAVDPITAADSGARPWEADRAFIMRCQEIATRHGCSVLLVTHPRMAKGQKPTLETMAGGLAYARFPDVVLWLANHDPPEQGTVNSAFGPSFIEYTNHIALFKTRDSAGRGMHIAYTFDRATLTLHEHGWIAREKRK
jgi:KaiC/GvpD/RAD55 family RecA-like ATPase